MIQGVNAFIPFGAPESHVPRVDAQRLSLALQTLAPKPRSGDGLAETLQRSFRLTLLEALNRSAPPNSTPLSGASTAAPRPDTAAFQTGEGTAPVTGLKRHGGPSWGAEKLVADGELELIQKAAERAGIDPRFLRALRLVENGGPGREFGVLSVPAPSYEDQARIAATTINRNLERFKRAGGQPVDPLSGRYTEEFVRFFSSRYAPVGADNDPSGLNRYHARNLARLYAQLAPKA